MKWKVVLTGKNSGREYVYGVASLRPATTEQVAQAAKAEHGRMLLTDRVDECVHDVAEVTPQR